MKYKISYPHGIMFHHFHSDVHPKGQGSISGEDFEAIIQFIGPENILSAGDWFEKVVRGGSKEPKVCITFDDSLKCQFDIAYPILEKYNIKAFFFVYNSVFEGKLENLEIFRYFRSKYFKDFDEYYHQFIKALEESELREKVNSALATFNPDEYLKNFSFYTVNDKKFRFLRDRVLNGQQYEDTLFQMMKAYKVDIPEISKNLWMSLPDLKKIAETGHRLGLHSESHPTVLAALEVNEQRKQYQNNKKFLENNVGVKIDAMSHPCNSYNEHTLKILNDLHINVGFRSNMQPGYESNLELPREDHINVYKQMKEDR